MPRRNDINNHINSKQTSLKNLIDVHFKNKKVNQYFKEIFINLRTSPLGSGKKYNLEWYDRSERDYNNSQIYNRIEHMKHHLGAPSDGRIIYRHYQDSDGGSSNREPGQCIDQSANNYWPCPPCYECLPDGSCVWEPNYNTDPICAISSTNICPQSNGSYDFQIPYNYWDSDGEILGVDNYPYNWIFWGGCYKYDGVMGYH